MIIGTFTYDSNSDSYAGEIQCLSTLRARVTFNPNENGSARGPDYRVSFEAGDGRAVERRALFVARGHDRVAGLVAHEKDHPRRSRDGLRAVIRVNASGTDDAMRSLVTRPGDWRARENHWIEHMPTGLAFLVYADGLRQFVTSPERCGVFTLPSAGRHRYPCSEDLAQLKREALLMALLFGVSHPSPMPSPLNGTDHVQR